MSEQRNIAASVRARLLNVARQSNRAFGDVLLYYGMERFLARLAQSPVHDQFVLKGALLLRAIDSGLSVSEPDVEPHLGIARMTRDIDLHSYSAQSAERIRTMIEQCLAVDFNDGVTFDAGSITVERIDRDADYAGYRLVFHGELDTARLHMRIDIGFGDALEPLPSTIAYPTLLDDAPISLVAYAVETSIAEKFHAMVILGDANSRMKDFYDIAALSRSMEFDATVLAGAIAATFEVRQTEPTATPRAFDESFATSQSKSVQWKAFAHRTQISGDDSFESICFAVRQFLSPIAERIVANITPSGVWQPAQGWQFD